MADINTAQPADYKNVLKKKVNSEIWHSDIDSTKKKWFEKTEYCKLKNMTENIKDLKPSCILTRRGMNEEVLIHGLWTLAENMKIKFDLFSYEYWEDNYILPRIV